VLRTALLCTTVAFVGMVHATPVNAASLVQNGGFESGLTGWTAEGNLDVLTGNFSCCQPSEGESFISFNGGNQLPNGILSQVFNTIADSIYLLSFDLAKGGLGVGAAALEVSLNGSSPLLFEIASLEEGGNPGSYSSFQYLFTADSDITTLSFFDVSSNAGAAFDTLLDNVSLVPTVPIIPEDPTQPEPPTDSEPPLDPGTPADPQPPTDPVPPTDSEPRSIPEPSMVLGILISVGFGWMTKKKTSI
jgi:hypothetical protein